MKLQNNKIYEMNFWDPKKKKMSKTLYLVKVSGNEVVCISMSGRPMKYLRNVLLSTMTYVGSKAEHPEYYL